MRELKELLLSENLKEIEAEIAERRELRDRMAGQLYPSILNDEIYELNGRVWELSRKRTL